MRRVVIGHDAAGKAVFTSDGEPPVQVVHAGGGLQIAKLWGTEGVPTLPAATADPTLQPHPYFPGPGGTRFVVVHFPPAAASEQALARGVDIDQATRNFLDQLPGLGELMEPDHPGMHASHSVDYGIVLAGEIDLELDDGLKKRLRAGDCYILNGGRHAWHNPGTETCTLAVVVVGAT